MQGENGNRYPFASRSLHDHLRLRSEVVPDRKRYIDHLHETAAGERNMKETGSGTVVPLKWRYPSGKCSVKRVLVAVAVFSLFVTCAATKSPESASDSVRRQEIINTLPDMAPMEGNGGLIYSRDTAIVIQAPKGWTCVCSRGIKEGGQAVLYPPGETQSVAHRIIKVEIAKLYGGEGLKAFVVRDIKRLGSKISGLTVKVERRIITVRHTKALMRLYFVDEGGRCGARAYIKHGKQVALFELDCRSRHDFGQSYSSFKRIVSNSLIGEMKFTKKK